MHSNTPLRILRESELNHHTWHTASFLELLYDGKKLSQNLKLWSESGILRACRQPSCDVSLSESARKIQLRTTDDRRRLGAARLRQRAKRWALTTSLVAEMNNRNTQHKVDVWGEKKKRCKEENRIVTLCFSWESNVDGWGTGRKESSSWSLQLARLTCRRTRRRSKPVAFFSAVYVQLSVNPMRDQAVRPEKKH